jgi:UDP-glucose 4-epimerase
LEIDLLKHHNKGDINPSRVVVLGGKGFIGGAITKALVKQDIDVLPIGSDDIDLTKKEASEKLLDIMRKTDVLVFVSAKAPCKNLDMMVDNTLMGANVCRALEAKSLSHLIYISSDAVYKDSNNPLTERSCAEPGSIHGVMHLSREVALRQIFSGPYAIVRPTLVYGMNDPHNGYGPNRFRRLALEGKEIVLFGEGEERRDHVDVEDVANLVLRIILRKSEGVINAVSGDAVSFRELAEYTAASFKPIVKVAGTLRSGSMPHNGYRLFDNTLVSNAFPGFTFRPWKSGMDKIFEQVKKEH